MKSRSAVPDWTPDRRVTRCSRSVPWASPSHIHTQWSLSSAGADGVLRECNARPICSALTSHSCYQLNPRPLRLNDANGLRQASSAASSLCCSSACLEPKVIKGSSTKNVFNNSVTPAARESRAAGLDRSHFRTRFGRHMLTNTAIILKQTKIVIIHVKLLFYL